MANVILVIGSVTAAQYTRARLDAFSMGIKPKIIRIKHESDNRGRLSSPLSGIEFKYDPGEIDMPYSEYCEKANHFARSLFKEAAGIDLEDVIGYVVDEPTWLDHTNPFINDQTPFDVLLDVDIRYVAYPDGRVEVL